MLQKRLIWQLYPSYLLITVLSLLAVTWYSTRALRDLYMDTLSNDLRTRAQAVGYQILEEKTPLTAESMTSVCKALGEALQCRITVVLPTGMVIGESNDDPTRMENHSDRPEIQMALHGKVGREIRYSHTLFQNMLYIAVPLYSPEKKCLAVIRTSLAANAVDGVLKSIYFQILLGGLAIALVAAVFCLIMSHRISRPLLRLKAGADRFAQGDLKTRLDVPESEEMAHLAHAMNKMAEQLDSRIRTITQQRKQQEAIFAGMVEGVLAVDCGKHVISMNQAAAQWLGVEDIPAENPHILDIIHDPDLYQMIDRALSSEEPFEGEILLGEKEKRHLQAHGAALSDTDGEKIGSVIVLHDVTRIRRLENLRRDFVANVSHELKTPITSIKGFVETLLDGAIDKREDAIRFLEIIAKQADRLHSIIEDLLSLSHIEQEKSSIALERYSLIQLLRSAVEVCKPKADENGISLKLDCSDSLQTRMNPPLLEQAVINLIDNALKYSEEGSSITIEAEESENQVCIRVRDSGCGIPAEHLPRIFERFYRVDKARSRKLGGTGLGLAIVKHIAQAHGGQITVESEMGVGSTFMIHLPSLPSNNSN